MSRRLPPQAGNLLAAVLFLSPFLFNYLVLLIYPFFLGIWISLHDWELLSSAANIKPLYLGVENYYRLLHDRYFWSSLGHSLLFTLLAVPSITVTALLLALALNRKTVFAAFLRGVFFVSGIFSVTVVTLVWLAILSPSRGLLGELFRSFGMEPRDLLADPQFAMPLIVIVTIWWSVGFPMSLFLAGLQQIPAEVYEAAELDHSGRLTTLFKITLPSLSRTTWLVLVLQIISHFQVFGQVLLLTGGGPANSTRVLVQYIYETSFRDWEVGYASAVSIVLFAIMFFVSLAQLRLNRGDR